MKRGKRTLLIFYILLFIQLGTTAQVPTKDVSFQLPFKGHFYCNETGVNIYLNLYEEDIVIPNFSFLGPTSGYMSGNIYGTWMLVKHQIHQNTAILRFSNDIGSDTQIIKFSQNKDNTFTYEAVNGNAIKKAIGRKLVKTTSHMLFKRK